MIEMLFAVLIGVAVGSGMTAIRRGRRSGVRSPGAWDGLVSELERARRYEHQFTLLRAELDRSEQLILLSQTGDTTVRRRSDCLWAVGRDLYVLLPEADRAQAQAWIRRVASALPAMRPDQVHIASFPDDGVTTRELLARLQPAPTTQPHGAFDARWAS